jgi:hypothetical protein
MCNADDGITEKENSSLDEWDLQLPRSPEDFFGPKLFLKKGISFELTPPFYKTPRSKEENIPLPSPEPVRPPSIEKQELEINLKNPSFSHGVIVTDQGGVISGEGLRIQARKIEYTNRIENGVAVQKIVAQEDLMVEYGGNVFVGSRLEFDVIKKSGMLWDGKTFVDVWFLGGDKIELREDGSYYIYNAYITTCESQDNTWEISAGKIKITKDRLLSARNIRFKFAKVPLLWLPSFKSNLKFFKDPPIRYKLTWDKGLGPRLSMRYRIFSLQNLDVYFRFDYRLTRGPGAAIESEYYSDDEKTIFLTKNYAAYDKVVPDERGNKRFRLQGLFHTQSQDGKTQIHMTYDRMSDDKMPSDFKSDDFEVNTQKRTILLIDHQEEDMYTSLRLQPRINSFQSLNQELPLVTAGVRPFSLGPTGILFENYVSGAYLDYVFIDQFEDLLPTRRSGRLETQQFLYRPISIKNFTFTPNIGLIGIFYSNNPEHDAIGQGVLRYGFDANTHLIRRFAKLKHVVKPYMTYTGLTSPLAKLDNHFIFSIDDGLFKLNLIKVGVKNSFFSYRQSLFSPVFIADLFTQGFFDDKTYRLAFPKGYLNLSWFRSFFAIQGMFSWNFEEQVLDYSNIRADITVNENLAFGVEFRHRSKFDWRKGNHENFILDVARRISALLDSTLSDERNTFLTRIQARLIPRMTCYFESHTGWGRKDEPHYNEYKIELQTLLACRWKLKTSYQHMPNDDRFTGGISLVK